MHGTVAAGGGDQQVGDDGARGVAYSEAGAGVVKLPRWLRWRSSQELDEEIAAHLDFATTAGIKRGLTPEEAAFAARRALGNATQLKERAREAAIRCSASENIAKDVRYALRSLRQESRVSPAAAVLCRWRWGSR